MRGICPSLLFGVFVALVFFSPIKVLAAVTGTSSSGETYTSPYNACANYDLCDYRGTNAFGQEIGPAFTANCGDPGFLCAINPFCKKYTGTECCTGQSGDNPPGGPYDACRNISDTIGACSWPGGDTGNRTIQCYNNAPAPAPVPPPPPPPAPNCVATDCNGVDCSASGQVCTITTNPCSCVTPTPTCSSANCGACPDCTSCIANASCGWNGS